MLEYRKANVNDIDELVRLRIEFLQEIGNIDVNIAPCNRKRKTFVLKIWF